MQALSSGLEIVALAAGLGPGSGAYLPLVTVRAAPTATPTRTPPVIGAATSTPTPPTTQDMVLIPAGSFQMGCDTANPSGEGCESDGLPLHSVYLDAYPIDRTEVTNAECTECMAAKVCCAPMDSFSTAYRPQYYGNPQYASYPVIWVFWWQARDYCAWKGQRLPGEAEWEKAARGSSDTRRYPWGNEAADCTRANSDDTYGGQSHQCVGETNAISSYPAGASPHGVLDMAGNVGEWVADWRASNTYSTSPPSNPSGPAHGDCKVLRGGYRGNSWHYLRLAYRAQTFPFYPSCYITGFRCAATVAAERAAKQSGADIAASHTADCLYGLPPGWQGGVQ